MHHGVEIPNSYSGLIALEPASGTAGPLRRPGLDRVVADCGTKWADILCLCARVGVLCVTERHFLESQGPMSAMYQTNLGCGFLPLRVSQIGWWWPYGD